MAGWFLRYQPAWLRWDLLAGLTTAAVVVPQALAYASLAGLPVKVGLYVATVPMVVYALVGTSRPLSVSSTSTISILTAGALVDTGAADDPGRAVAAASLLALLVGGVLAIAGLLRLGFLADFISSPVLAGFKAGMGLVIAASQLGKVLGVPVEVDTFFAKVWSALGQLGDANPATVALALGGLAVLLGLRRWAPMVPGPLVVVILGIALVGLTDLAGRGGGAGRSGERRPSQLRAPRPRRCRRPAARCGRDRADVVHRVHLGRPGLRRQGRSAR